MITSLAVLYLGCAHLLPPVMHACNPNVIYRVVGPQHTLYLTLDDGPSDATGAILDVLKKYGVKATFFIISDHITPAPMQRIVAEGHALGHHMKTTHKLDSMSEGQFEAEFRQAERQIGSYGRIVAFRPPSGSLGQNESKFVRSAGYPIVVGTIYPLDHLLEDEKRIEQLARFLVVDRGIIILHDTTSRGRRTARILDRLIPRLQQEGYRFGALSSLAPFSPRAS